MTVQSVGGDYGSFQEQVRVSFNNEPVLESPRLALIGIYTKVNGLPGVLRNESPFDSGRKTGASATPEAGLLYNFDDVIGLAVSQVLAQPLVPSQRFVHPDLAEVWNMHILRQNFHRQRPWEENIGTGIVDCGFQSEIDNPQSAISIFPANDKTPSKYRLILP